MMRQSDFRPLRFFLSVIVAVLLASSGLALVATAQRAPAPSREPDAITGRILGTDGRPLVNASVSAVEAGARGPNRIQHSTTADDEGYFRLTGLPPGEYYISASSEGYLGGSVRATDRPDQYERYFRPGASVTITLQKGGVITGRVTNAEDQPVVAVVLSLEYAREDNGRQRAASFVAKEGLTDDRGIYRIFGLQPGSYLVRVGGRGQQDSRISAYDADAPTYYPSATRDTAAEVRVLAGEEVTGIDIRYRGERGYAIRGAVAGKADFNRRPYLWLTRLPGGAQAGSTSARVEDQSLKFDFEGLPDGEYEMRARRSGSGEEDDGAASLPRRVTIKGADVNGIEMRLIPLSSLSGRFVLAEGPANCQAQQRARLMDVSLIAHRDAHRDGGSQPAPEQGRPNEQGEFAIRELEAGRYWLAVWLPNIERYLRAITLPGPAPAERPLDISRHGLTLRPGERMTRLTVTLAEGAAFLSGAVVPTPEGGRLTARLRVHLVPAEVASADDVLRYAETDVAENGRFTLRNLSPGRYWLLARAVPDDESPEQPVRPAAWDAGDRLKLRHEARAAKVEIELQACQRVMGHVLRFAPH